MPTPLIPLPLVTPGHFGLNTAYAGYTSLGPEWATVFQNTYFDINGRIAARNGWTNLTSSPPAGTPAAQVLFEYVKQAATTQVIWTGADNKIYLGTGTPTSITGSLTPTGANWQFLNFNNKCIGVQAGNTSIVYTGSGSFANIVAASGSTPIASCGAAAFGRLWLCSSVDNNTISYCGLLDETNWGAAGSGTINMASIWTHGTDQVVGISAVGANLIVFGKRHIVLFADGSGSTLGMDPASMYVVDTVEGTGLLARDTVQVIGTGDLLYLSPTGVQSLQRVVADKTNPLTSLDRHCWDYIKSYYVGETPAAVRSVYSPNDYLYMLILPTSDRVFAYDTRRPIQGSPLVPDGSFRISEWLFTANCGIAQANLTVLFGFAGGLIGQYTGYTDNGATFQWNYSSPYMADVQEDDGGQLENRLKIPKRAAAILYTVGANILSFEWAFDFNGSSAGVQVPLQGSQVPEYGTAEYGTNGVYNVNDPSAIAGVNYSQYSGTLVVRALTVPLSGTGRWFQLSLTATINGANLALQQLDVYIKPGSMASS